MCLPPFLRGVLLGILVLFSAVDSVFATQIIPEVLLDCPSALTLGAAGYCRVETSLNVDFLEITWKDKTFVSVLRQVKTKKQGEFLVGVGLSSTFGFSRLSVVAKFKGGEYPLAHWIDIRPQFFPEQYLTLPSDMVNPPDEVLERIRQERKETSAVMSLLTPGRFWSFPLVRPVSGEISSTFGLRRFLNGEPKAPHKGLDIAAKEGEPVLASAAGIVVLSADQYYAGNAVFVDHGEGVVSMYFHLSQVLVTNGQVVRAGDSLGLVGSTGRSTGPHLHFGMSVLGELIDPLPLLQTNDSQDLR